MRTAQSGFTLVEAIVATTIATIAVVGLAYSFGTGRALVNRYEVARVALGAAQRRAERLSILAPGSADLTLGAHGPFDVVVDGRTLCHEAWTVTAYDDPANGTSAFHVDLKRVRVAVTWGDASPAETIELTTLLPTR